MIFSHCSNVNALGIFSTSEECLQIGDICANTFQWRDHGKNFRCFTIGCKFCTHYLPYYWVTKVFKWKEWVFCLPIVHTQSCIFKWLIYQISFLIWTKSSCGLGHGIAICQFAITSIQNYGKKTFKYFWKALYECSWLFEILSRYKKYWGLDWRLKIFLHKFEWFQNLV